MNLPSLEEIIQWFKDRMRPKDATIGNGVSDWDITAEYVPNLMVGGERAYGALCSPGNHNIFLTADDVAAKRAHMLVRTPRNDSDLNEMRVTLRHEFDHAFQATYAKMTNENRAAIENHAHSMDNFLKQLTPDELALFARSMPKDTARAYRAKEGDMPVIPEENKDKQPDKPAPAMQEGATRSVEEIQAEMAMVDPTDATKLGALAVELRNALIKKGIDAQAGGNGAAPVAPVEPPTMGMKPEDAYARQAATDRKEAVEAIIEANPHLDDKQKAMARKMPSVKDARELVASYPRAANQNDPARMGMQGNPKTDPKAAMKPMARAMATAAENPMLRRIAGIGTMDNDGLHYEPQAGVLFYVDGTEQLNHQRAKLDARRTERRGAA